jgi:HSP20 family protein
VGWKSLGAEEAAMSDWESSLRDLRMMQERMNALLEESVRGQAPESEEPVDAAWAPAADAFERETEILLLVDVPGVAREDLRLDVAGGTLVVRGERRIPGGLDRGDARRVERAYGAFSRAFELPASVDETRIRAEHRDGVLAIRLPKRERSGGRPFQITVE